MNFKFLLEFKLQSLIKYIYQSILLLIMDFQIKINFLFYLNLLFKSWGNIGLKIIWNIKFHIINIVYNLYK